MFDEDTIKAGDATEVGEESSGANSSKKTKKLKIPKISKPKGELTQTEMTKKGL